MAVKQGGCPLPRTCLPTGAVTVVVPLALVLSACGVRGPQADMDQVFSSDPELAALAAEILPTVEAASGLTAAGPVRVEYRSWERLESYLLAKLDEEMPPERARAVVESYRLLGLVGPEFDLRSTLLGVYREQVAGFYEPDSATLFIIDDQTGTLMEQVLVHELVHALQDHWLDLDSITDMDRVGADRANAAHAVIEGHAMVATVAAALPGETPSLEQLRGALATVAAGIEGLTAAAYPELAAAPRILREPLVSGYVDGGFFVLRVWEERGRNVPLGELMPASTDQLLGAPLEEEPVEIALEVLGADVVHEGQLGRRELAILFEERLGEGWDGLADGWAGDRFALLRGAGGERGLAWFLVADDAEARTTIKEALIDGGFGSPATVHDVEVAGRAGILVRIGDLQGVTVTAAEGARR